jgi:hypothetical protein
MTAPRRALLLIVCSGLALETVNQLDRWRRLADGSYEPYGASFVKAHLLAYAGAFITLAGLVAWSATSHGKTRVWASAALAGSVLHALGLAADVPYHLSTADSGTAHLVGYVGLAVEAIALVCLTRMERAHP